MKFLFILEICNLDQLEKDMPRKTNLNISTIFLKISLPSFPRNVPTTENIYTKHYFISTNIQNQNVYFQFEFFSRILIQSFCFVKIWLVFKPLQKLQTKYFEY